MGDSTATVAISPGGHRRVVCIDVCSCRLCMAIVLPMTGKTRGVGLPVFAIINAVVFAGMFCFLFSAGTKFQIGISISFCSRLWAESKLQRCISDWEFVG